jgi:hypothetical protein
MTAASDCQLLDEARHFAETIRDSKTVRTAIFYSNKIPDNSASWFGDAMKVQQLLCEVIVCV